jgi:hypothetical protein
MRGTKGTASRSHVAGATIFANPIYLTDNQGSALLASTGMPFVDASQNQFYLNTYAGRDMMDDQAVERFDEYSAYLWNRIAGKRPVCGNYNAPCNINEHFQAIPQANSIQVKDTNGLPIANALVSIYHAGRQCYTVNGQVQCIFYGKVYDAPPLHVSCTNPQGQIGLGPYPFGRAANGAHDILQTNGWGSGTLAVKIVVGNKVGVAFLEVTAFNLAYWRGNQVRATYPVTFAHWVTTTTTRSPACSYLPLIQTDA